MNNIGAQLYTVREFCKTENDLKTTFEKISAIGYKSVQVSGVGDIKPETIKKLADDNNLSIDATHISYESLANDMEKVIKTHLLYNCKYIGIGAMPKDYRNSYEGYFEFAKLLNEAGEKLKKMGLILIYHNNAFEFEKYNNKCGIDILIDETNKDFVQFEIDTYWVQVGGASPQEYIEKLKNRIDVVRFKDLAIKNGEKQMAEIGKGNINFANILKICKSSNVKHIFVEQDVCQTDPFECLETSYNYIACLTTVEEGNCNERV